MPNVTVLFFGRGLRVWGSYQRCCGSSCCVGHHTSKVSEGNDKMDSKDERPIGPELSTFHNMPLPALQNLLQGYTCPMSNEFRQVV